MFDLDGTLVDTEVQWARAREALARRTGGTWHEGAHEEMMGMSSGEWSAYMHEKLGVPLAPQQILDELVEELGALYREQLPLLPGALDAVHAATSVGPLAVASSSPAGLIELILELAGVREAFAVVLSSEEVARGKPAPDVYTEACARLGVAAQRAVAVEDSESGMVAAREAGLRVIAVPNPHYPPPDEALAHADAILDGIAHLTPAVLRGEA